MTSTEWKKVLKRLPFAGSVERHLAGHGHDEREAEMGALLIAGLDLLLIVLLFNSFLVGLFLSLPHTVSGFVRERPTESVFAGLLLTILVLTVFFRLMGRLEEKKQLAERQVRREETGLRDKRDALKRGAMAEFDRVFRADLDRKYPGIELLSTHVVDTTPRIRFRMARYTTETGGNVDANYRLFLERLFSDTLHLIETTFQLSPNIPAVIVDAIFNFISRKAQFYDGAVLSVKATREVFRSLDLQGLKPFKALTAFDFRYNDGLEVEAVPEEESKSARLLERLKQQMPKSEIRYEQAAVPVDDSWQSVARAASPAAEPGAATDPAKLTPEKFQAAVADLLVRDGFELKKQKKIPGGTIEILAGHPHPLLGGDFTVLARQYPPESQVHAEMVSELDQLVRDEMCQRGLYLVTGQFTEEARNIARKMPLTLVDGRKMRELAARAALSGAWWKPAPGSVPDLSNMPLTAFQDTVGAFLQDMGFTLQKIRKMNDGAILARVEAAHPLIGGEFAVIARQVPEKPEIPAETVLETTRIMNAEFCPRGILLVTGRFSAEAQSAARSLAVELVDKPRWVRLYTGG